MVPVKHLKFVLVFLLVLGDFEGEADGRDIYIPTVAYLLDIIK